MTGGVPATEAKQADKVADTTLARPRGTIVKPPNDDLYSLTRQRAEMLAEEIRVFWEARCTTIRVWVEPLNDTTTVEWVVRSNIALVERR